MADFFRIVLHFVEKVFFGDYITSRITAEGLVVAATGAC